MVADGDPDAVATPVPVSSAATMVADAKFSLSYCFCPAVAAIPVANQKSKKRGQNSAPFSFVQLYLA